MHVKPGGELENYTTSDCWGETAVSHGGRGRPVRYQGIDDHLPRQLTLEQRHDPLLPRRQHRPDHRGTWTTGTLEISFDEDNYKTWLLAGNRVIADTLRVNYSANLLLTAADEQSLTIGSLLWLSSGSLDNSDSNVQLTIPDGGMVQRAVGELDHRHRCSPVWSICVTRPTPPRVITGPRGPGHRRRDRTTTSRWPAMPTWSWAGTSPSAAICAATDADLITGASTPCDPGPAGRWPGRIDGQDRDRQRGRSPGRWPSRSKRDLRRHRPGDPGRRRRTWPDRRRADSPARPWTSTAPRASSAISLSARPTTPVWMRRWCCTTTNRN